MKIEYDDLKDYLEWSKTKSELKFNYKKPSFPVLYNCIYWAYMGCNIGSEEGKHRPILILRTYMNSTTISVIPLTSQRLRDKCQYHVDLENMNSTALCEQLRVIDMSRLDKPMYKNGKISAITETDWKAIDFQIRREYLMCKLK